MVLGLDSPGHQAGLVPTKVEFSEDSAQLSFATAEEVTTAFKKLNETEGGSTAVRVPQAGKHDQTLHNSVPTSPSAIIHSFDGVRTTMLAYSWSIL